MSVMSLDRAEPFTVAGIQFRMVLPRNAAGSCEVVWERLEAMGATPDDSHAHFDQIFFILCGRGEVTVAGTVHAVEAQDTVFIPSGDVHSVKNLGEDGLEYLYINVWRNGIPDAEKDWRKVYQQIDRRRTDDSLQSRS